MAITATFRGSGNSTNQSSSIAFSPTSDFTANSYAVLIFAWYSSDVTINSVTDTDGNTWTQRAYETGGTTTQGTIGIYTCDSVSLTTADTITVSMANQREAKMAFLYEVVGDSPITYVSSGTDAFSSNGTITTSSIATGNIVIGANRRDSNAAPTDDSDTTNGNWSTSENAYSGLSSPNSRRSYINSQYKIVTGSGTQTYNITTGANGCIAYIELAESTAATFDPLGTLGFFGI